MDDTDDDEDVGGASVTAVAALPLVGISTSSSTTSRRCPVARSAT